VDAEDLPPAGGGAGRQRILIVEDDLHTRRINATALASAGYEVIEALDGAAAVRDAIARRPDLIVMDLALPGVGGLEATARIKQDLGAAAPPIIVLTARAMREDHEAAVRAGCDAYLPKPIDPFDLLHEVRRLLALRAEAR
jgi:CheY-like chemotaxis protein